jgi:serine/threonine protein kinase
MSHIGNYELDKIIGRGRFGRVYKGIHRETGEFVAVKLEDRHNESKLIDEANTIKNIRKYCKGVPEIYRIGNSHKWNYMIMSYLGPNLEELFIYCKRTFTLRTSVLLSLQIFNIIKRIHESGIIHRDIKPDNFVVGFGDSHNKIFLIDFGLSVSFINNKTMQHNDYVHKHQFTGSFRYSSINNHKGIQQSRRDDLESISYMMVYFYKGQLPWQNIPARDKRDKLKKTYQKKMDTPIEELCEDCPREFKQIVSYCRKLGYKERPDYPYILYLLNKVKKKNNIRDNDVYDWNMDNDTDSSQLEMKKELENIKKIKIQKTYKRLNKMKI